MTRLIDRRLFLRHSSSALGFSLLPTTFWSQIASSAQRKNKFFLNIHFGSSCSIASGLVQPLKKGEWPVGTFRRGSAEFSQNPLLNLHYQEGNLIFTDYHKFLASKADDMCLMNGTPQSLAHEEARSLQLTGFKAAGMGPEWAMAVSEQTKHKDNPNPFVISNGTKTFSVPSITPITASNLAEMKIITSDGPSVPKGEFADIWNAYSKMLDQHFSTSSKDSVQLLENMNMQIETLVKGLPQLNELEKQGDVTNLSKKLAKQSITEHIKQCHDKEGIIREFNQGISNRLILAGLLAKSGVASGMTFLALGEDHHNGGAEIFTARKSSAIWAQIALFWEWIKEQQLDEDVVILVTQEFGRNHYNSKYIDGKVITPNGEKIVRSFGRDHGLFMGMMVINKNVPTAGRIGAISSNLTPIASVDAVGGLDGSKPAHTSVELVGSMLMRLYPELYPSERSIRAHWSSFVPVSSIVT